MRARSPPSPPSRRWWLVRNWLKDHGTLLAVAVGAVAAYIEHPGRLGVALGLGIIAAALRGEPATAAAASEGAP